MDKISALMDGELPREEAEQLVRAVRERADLREAWATYHLIGEALRGEPCADCGVMAMVKKRLAAEPTVFAPRRRFSSEFGKRWALPSMAAAAAVAVVSWMAFEMQPGTEPPSAASASHVVVPTVMQSPDSLPGIVQPVHLFPQTTTTTPAPIQLTARELDAYLIAHQVMSPRTTLQGLAPYVRTVTNRSVEPGR